LTSDGRHFLRKKMWIDIQYYILYFEKSIYMYVSDHPITKNRAHRKLHHRETHKREKK